MSGMEICDCCDGSGEGVATTTCQKCHGAGGYPSSPTDELCKAVQEALDFTAVIGDFRNGVTDPTGSIDEGEVAWCGIRDRLRLALIEVRNKK